MKTVDEIATHCELAARQVRRARRIRCELGRDPGPALSIARATMRTALRELEELMESPDLLLEEEPALV